MAKVDYHEPAEPAAKTPFALQAAKFSFWTPMVVILFSLLVNYALANATGSTLSYRQAFGWLVLTLNVASVLAGLVALLGIRKHGAKGILLKSCIGILLSGYMLGSAVYLAYGLKPADRVAQRLVGDWESGKRTVNGVSTSNRLSLRADKTASVRISVDANSATIAGRWAVAWNGSELPRLGVKWDPGVDPRMGDGVVWVIEHVDNGQLTLLGASGDASTREIYTRLPADK